jgi:uncharacterized protein (DUF488 family)
LVSLLGDAHMVVLADVRRFPASRRNPQFNRPALAAALAEHRIDYHWFGDRLGGRRTPDPGPSRHPAWHDPAFRGYAEYMDETEFRTAFSELLVLARGVPTAIMCAETLWWRCHRRLLSDAAVLAGTQVTHLLGPGRSQPHRLHPAVRAGDDGWPVYDVGVQPELL